MKKLICVWLLAVLLILSACSVPGDEEKVQAVNPLREVTVEQIQQELGISFREPEGAEEVQYFIIGTGGSAIAEMRFLWNGAASICRIQSDDIPEGDVPDISGMFFDWDKEADAMVGCNDAKLTWNEGAEGVIRWYDYAPGLLYSISMSDGASEAALLELAELLYISVQGDVDALSEEVDAPAELTNLFAAISQNYQFGVLGSSLRAAIYAGTLMDWFAANPVGRAEVDAAVIDFLSTLDTETLESFPKHLEYVEDAAKELLGENGEALLDACGYEPTHAPWDGAQIAMYFDMIWEVVGKAE